MNSQVSTPRQPVKVSREPPAISKKCNKRSICRGFAVMPALVDLLNSIDATINPRKRKLDFDDERCSKRARM